MSLKAGDVSFMIGQDDWKKGRDRKKGEGFRITARRRRTSTTSRSESRPKAAGSTTGPTDQPWGVRDISLTDPDGFKITIANEKR